MSAFFGVDEHNAQGYIDHCIVCIPHQPDGNFNLRNIVSPIRHEDVVFIKRCTPGASLHISAVGIVQSDYLLPVEAELCMSVDWVWKGEKVLENVFDETLALCGEPFYEEHNIVVQREIINLLPKQYQIPLAW